jgi:acylphosphatase
MSEQRSGAGGERRAVTVRVYGVVQGVGFRFHCQRQAQRAGAAGWVRNEADGSVTAHVEGDEQAVATLVDWCRQGPPSGAVERVETAAAEPERLSGFSVR